MKAVLILIMSVSVFAKIDFAKRKQMQIENLDKRITNLTELKSCISSASKKEDLKACHKKRKAFREQMKQENSKRKEMRKKLREERKNK